MFRPFRKSQRAGALALLLAACAPPAAMQSPAENWSSGTYEFTLRAGSSVVTGIVTSRDGSMLVRPKEGKCFIDRTVRDQEDHVFFKCDGIANIANVKLDFDPRDPQARSRWSGTVQRTVTESECTSYTVDARGQRICASTRTMSVLKDESVGGTIILKLLAP